MDMDNQMSYHAHFSHMIRLMADELNQLRKPHAKTMYVNRIIMHQLIDFMAVYQNIKDNDVAESIGISNRTLYSIKNESRTNYPDYTSIRTTTIDNIIDYAYSLAERIEQKGVINCNLKYK